MDEEGMNWKWSFFILIQWLLFAEEMGERRKLMRWMDGLDSLIRRL
jgi:uncharacterized protein YpmS